MKPNQKKLTALLGAVCLLSLCIMAAALSIKPPAASFVPPPFDEGAREGLPQTAPELGWGMLDAKAYQVGICGAVTAWEDAADLWLTNPEENTVWLKVRILNHRGEILGESGLIRPGEYVQSVRLESPPEDGTPITLKIMAYQPETYYSEGAVALNTTVMRGEVK